MTELQHLPVKLTAEEMTSAGKEIGELDLAMSLAREELDAVKKAAKETQSQREARRRELARILREGHEARDVECELRFDFDAGVVKTVRLDTDEVVSEREVTDEERQTSLTEALFKAPKESRRVREAKKRNPEVVAESVHTGRRPANLKKKGRAA